MEKISEASIQQSIFIYFHNKYPKYIIHSVPNGIGFTIPKIVPLQFHSAIRKAIAMAIDMMKKVGLVPGVADLIIHLPNAKCVMCEVKTEIKKKKKKQKKIEAKIKAMGGNYILVRSLSEFKEKIKAFL